jgi:hypothetical protein
MKSIFSAMIITLSILSPHAARAEFRITESRDTLLQIRDRLTVEDLAIAERGIIAGLSACNRDGTLYISGRHYLLEDAPEYGLIWRVKRLQGDKVSVSVSKKAGNATVMRTALAQTMLSALVTDCGQDRFQSAPLYEIDTINGEANSAALLAAIP